MAIILTNRDEQRLGLNEDDEEPLRPYKGLMEFDQLGDRLEHLYPAEVNQE